MTRAKFHPGSMYATPGVLEKFRASGDSPLEYLAKHLTGDWGVVDRHDWVANDAALVDGSRLLSAYQMTDGTRFWVITEAKGDAGRRESTTFLLPSEY